MTKFNTKPTPFQSEAARLESDARSLMKAAMRAKNDAYRIDDRRLQEETSQVFLEAVHNHGRAAMLRCQAFHTSASGTPAELRRLNRRAVLLRLALWAITVGGLAFTGLYFYVVSALGLSLVASAATLLSGVAVEVIGRRARRHPSGTPLRLLDSIVKALWSKKTYDRVFKPARADIAAEWSDAKRAREPFRAWWIKRVRGPYTIIESAVRQLPWSAIKKITTIVLEMTKR